MRNCTHGQNQMNIKNRQISKTSKYLGVCFDKSRNKWYAQLEFNKKHILKRRFKTEEEAAKARDEVAREYFGEFANLNF